MIYNIYLVGVGGQGVLTIGELIADAAFLQEIPVNYYPTEGMAQRGGFVKAQIRLGQNLVGPQIPEKSADLVISMEVSESLKAIRYVKPGSHFVLYGHVWLPTAALLGKADYPTLDQVNEQISLAGGRLIYIDPHTLPLQQGSPVAHNLYVLGVSAGCTSLGTILTITAFEKAIEHRWPSSIERHFAAFHSGFERGSN